jgi:beta-glucanase (GH16 family)
MRSNSILSLIIFSVIALHLQACKSDKNMNTEGSEVVEEKTVKEEKKWKTDFLDEFETFNTENWQDQRIWVNNETHCYVADGKFNTREVSDGTLKIRVVKLDEEISCDNMSKYGEQHPPTRYVAGRICSKNKKEFIKGKWTARLRLKPSGKASMFPAWWLLGAQNNEPPVQEDNENVCWPLTGSGEIDIFEHHGDYHNNKFTTGAIKSLGECDKADWQNYRKDFDVTLEEYHEYSVEWEDADLVYRVDGKEVYRNEGEGDNYPEPMFAILNFAKITDSPMEEEQWEMEVDWVKHESRIE